MGKKGKKAQAGKPKKLTPKDVGKRMDTLIKKLEEELEGADLFAPLPPTEDCAICLVPLPRVVRNTTYNACCGKIICNACSEENKAVSYQKKLTVHPCPFCRGKTPTNYEEGMRQLEARAAQNDHEAWDGLGENYRESKDDLKAIDCYIRAVDLGSPRAAAPLAEYCREGIVVARDLEKEALFSRIGALRGSCSDRHNIGVLEYCDLGNHEIAIRHWKIAAEAGMQASLDALKTIFNANGKQPGKEFVSKEYLDSVYRACHAAQEEVKSEEREKHGEHLDRLIKSKY